MKFPFLMATLLLTGFLAAPAAAAAAGAPPLSPAPPAPPSALAFSSLTPSPSAAFAAAASSFSFTDASCADAAMAATAGRMEEESNRESTLLLHKQTYPTAHAAVCADGGIKEGVCTHRLVALVVLAAWLLLRKQTYPTAHTQQFVRMEEELKGFTLTGSLPSWP
eukprot:1161315-Pelagomonas_calceolata.AAC.1